MIDGTMGKDSVDSVVSLARWIRKCTDVLVDVSVGGSGMGKQNNLTFFFDT